MTALQLSRTSKIPPNPNKVRHTELVDLGYTCHMAVIHWALMVLGCSQQQANATVGRYALSTCPSCTQGIAVHGSLAPRSYGNLFCWDARQINRQDLQHGTAVGDVLITEHWVMPMHSMVLRQHRGPDHVTVRGFNNVGTLGTGNRDAYDPVSHNITKDKYWQHGDTKFGVNGVPLWVVPHARFMQAARGVLQGFRG